MMFLPVITICVAGVLPTYDTCQAFLAPSVQPTIEQCDEDLVFFLNQPETILELSRDDVVIHSLQCLDLLDEKNSKKIFNESL